ncbi:hypothetical protein HKBW3S47_00753, partial [Candidatus Hakubella thermalkaliphila]
VQEQETLKNGDENGPLEPENERKIGSSQGDSAELGLGLVMPSLSRSTSRRVS